MKPEYQALVKKLEAEGATTSDAQGHADLHFDPHFANYKCKECELCALCDKNEIDPRDTDLCTECYELALIS